MISKKIMLASFCLMAVSGVWAGHSFDKSLSSLLKEVAELFSQIERSAITRSKNDPVAVTKAKKRAIKQVKARLKQVYVDAKDGDETAFEEKRELYRAFKNDIYRVWKATGHLPKA